MVSFVEESARRGMKKLKKRSSMEELSKHPPTIPWLKKVERVTVTEA
ncbi:MAG: hypothetical protein ACE5HG_03275 [Candidatus Bathyarchaeia archaeon]